MDRDPLSREAALDRVKSAGIGAGKFGAPADKNPYARAPSMTEERDAWEAGRIEGSSQRKRGVK